MPADPTSEAPDPALIDAARAAGVDTEYVDWRGDHRTVSTGTLQSVLAAMELGTRAPAADAAGCLVIRQGGTPALPGPGRVELEDGTSRTFDGRLPGDLPIGYHRIVADQESGARTLIVTPARLELPGTLADRPGWGLAVQLYSVRSRRSWGLGDLNDLRELATRSAREHGADFVLVNPIHAGEAVPPLNPSPYLPTSRRFANPIYLRIEDVWEYATLDPDRRAQVDRLGADVRAEHAEGIDRDAVWLAKTAALELLLQPPLAADRAERYERFRAQHGEALMRFATWSAACEVHGNDWHEWPEPLRDPQHPAVASFAAEHAGRVEFHARVQWVLDEQLVATQQAVRAAGMSIGIVHDVAVGVSPNGADAWANQSVMATSVRVGAPPDAYSQLGQDWQQPPWQPDRLAATDYRPIREMFAATLRYCGGVRVDHIIGLFRLWWIPSGHDPRDGTYVRYDHDALIGILALEAQRVGAVVIGEDLGNVEPATRAYLHDRGLLGTSILWFETDPDSRPDPLPAPRWRPDCLASVTTHDLPPTAGYLAGEHIRLRDELGLLTRPASEEYADAEAERARWRRRLIDDGLLDSGAEPDDAELIVALHRFLARTPSRLRCVALVDLVGDRRTQNQPGTVDEYPNWRVPLTDAHGRPVLLEDVFATPGAAAILAAVTAG